MIDLLGNIILAIFCLGVIFMLGLLFIAVLIPDDVEEIDNSEGSIECCYIDRKCIKTKLYTKCNNCSDCPIYEDMVERNEND